MRKPDLAMTKQVTNTILMIRPAHFGYNPETAENNTFQSLPEGLDPAEIQERALTEFDDFVKKLRSHEIYVDVLSDSASPEKPDAIFPNNWISLHADGSVITYPMFSPKRRLERREEVIDQIGLLYEVKRRYSFEHYEEKHQFLEGTGSMVLDRAHKIVYACLSERTDVQLLDKFCVLREFRKVAFHAESAGVPIYHTNVLMALGRKLAIICLEAISDPGERETVRNTLIDSGKEVVEITSDQMNAFAGNMLELRNDSDEFFMAMSSQAFHSLSAGQKARIEQFSMIIHSSLDMIEKLGGGSARCMMAENFLPSRDDLQATS